MILCRTDVNDHEGDFSGITTPFKSTNLPLIHNSSSHTTFYKKALGIVSKVDSFLRLCVC